nr:hypothetical protein [Clostridium sp. D46t1_190503_E9]
MVIDTQKSITNEKLYRFDTFVSNVKETINKARENSIEVIYIRHDDGEGGDLAKGTEGFEHGFHILVPQNANTTIDNEFMTAEQSYKYHNEFMWNGRYAECISLDETIRKMSI